MPSRKRAAPSEEPIDSKPPTDIDPYEILDLTPSATADEVKKAYRKVALKHHPDKVPPSEAQSAKEAFQRIALAYAVLSSPHRRARYDATGSTSESILDDDDDGEAFDWLAFYRTQYANVVTEEKIHEFADSYKGSDEEKAELLEAYTKYRGDMGKVYESVMLSDVLVDDERFRGAIDGAIEAGEIEGFTKYVNETEKSKRDRVKKAEKAAKEFVKEEAKRKKKAEAGDAKAAKGESDLLAMIQGNRQQKRDNFLDNLEAKYAGKEKVKPRGKKRKSDDDEPSEEAFQAASERLKKAKASR